MKNIKINMTTIADKITAINMTTIADKITAINNIANPHIVFNMNDFYGDHPNGFIPHIEKLTILYYKLQTCKNKNIGKIKQQEIVNLIKQLNIGNIEMVNFYNR